MFACLCSRSRVFFFVVYFWDVILRDCTAFLIFLFQRFEVHILFVCIRRKCMTLLGGHTFKTKFPGIKKTYSIATPYVNFRSSTAIQLKSWLDGTKYNALRGRYAVQYADSVSNHTNNTQKKQPPPRNKYYSISEDTPSQEVHTEQYNSLLFFFVC